MIIQVHPADNESRSIRIIAEQPLLLPEEFTLMGEASFTGEYLGLGEGLFLIDGVLSFRAKSLCARCIKPVEIQLDIPFRERFAREDVQQEDEEIYAFAGDSIDLSKALQEAALTALPMRVLCREDCKGLCPVCGTDRNENDCGCEPIKNNAFSALKQLDLHKEV